MKRFVYAALCVVSLCLSGCGYDDDEVWNAINDQEERIAALEEWQKTANENIAALQAIVNGNDYITSVEEIKEGDEIIGYTINFHRQGEVTIYNGKDGEDGEMPVIGVTEGEDGRWYWTVNGELMEDADGNPVCASGKDGEDGEDGEDGQDGQDGTSSSGVTPVIKLGSELNKEYGVSSYNDYASYLSVDGGKTWTQMNVTYGWTGYVLDVIWNSSDGYYSFEFKGKDGYSFSIQIPKYAGLILNYVEQIGEESFSYRSINDGVLSVNTGKKFTIECSLFAGGNLDYILEDEEGNKSEWKVNRVDLDATVIDLNFEAIGAPGTATLKITLISSSNEVTYYQVKITAFMATQTIEKSENPALVTALADALGDGILNEDGDVEITPQLIQEATTLDVSEQNIESLEGIEAFVNLRYLDCSNNPLTSLDVSVFSELTDLHCDNCFNQSPASRSYSKGVLDLSENTKLQTLSCAENGLTELILPDTQTLIEVNCDDNQLTVLDVSKNTNLRYLFGNGNKFTSLDVSNNTLLMGLEIRNNLLTDINLSANESLRTLAVHGNQLTTLDVSKNGKLEYLFCGSNQLVSLDVFSNENLVYLNCLFNQIQTLDIKKNIQLQDLYCGNQAGTLSLMINEEQQSLWENNWEGNNYNVVLADGLVHSSGGNGSNFGNGGVY